MTTPAASGNFQHNVVPSVPVTNAVPNATPPNSAPIVTGTPSPADSADSSKSNPPTVVSTPTIDLADRSTVWDVPFDHLTLSESIDAIGKLIDRGVPSYVITANLNYVMLHHRDREMHPITEDADLILADGQPIVWRSRLDKQALPERVAGSEMIFDLAQRAAREGWGIYFLGGMPGVAASCALKLKELNPELIVSGVESPPFRQLTDAEQREQDRRIQQSGAKLLLVAFGQPKGERWIHEHYKRLGVPVCIQLGASFDFIAGTATRAPIAFQKVGMEWAYRMFSDPTRLIPRYWSNATFLMGALIRDWKRAVTRWGMGDWA